MGSFNTTCGLTNQIIDIDTETVMIMLTANKRWREMSLYAWDHFAPIPVLLEGKYNSYGSLEDIKIFQSKELFDNEKMEKLQSILFADLNSKIGEGHNFKTMDEMFQERELFFLKKDFKVMYASELIRIIQENEEKIQKKELLENMEQIISGMKDMLVKIGFKTIEEAQQYIKENKDKVEKQPVSFMFFKKDAFLNFVNNYGVGDTNEDHYATQLQTERNKDLTQPSTKLLTENMDVVQGNQDYAGANAPRYSYANLIKEGAKKLPEREDLITLSKLHALDTILLNEYFSVLGKTFQPSMYVSEDIKHYGHTEAYAFQQKLLEDAMPAKKMKIK